MFADIDTQCKEHEVDEDYDDRSRCVIRCDDFSRIKTAILDSTIGDDAINHTFVPTRPLFGNVNVFTPMHGDAIERCIVVFWSGKIPLVCVYMPTLNGSMATSFFDVVSNLFLDALSDNIPTVEQRILSDGRREIVFKRFATGHSPTLRNWLEQGNSETVRVTTLSSELVPVREFDVGRRTSITLGCELGKNARTRVVYVVPEETNSEQKTYETYALEAVLADVNSEKGETISVIHDNGEILYRVVRSRSICDEYFELCVEIRKFQVPLVELVEASD